MNEWLEKPTGDGTYKIKDRMGFIAHYCHLIAIELNLILGIDPPWEKHERTVPKTWKVGDNWQADSEL